MTDVLAFLSTHMRAVLLGLGLAGLLVISWLAWVLARARKKQEEAPADESPEKETLTPAPVAMVTQAAELELSFRSAMKTLRSVSSGSGHRYRTPWYLVLGPTGTGKSTLMHTLPLPRRVQNESDDPTEARPAAWHFFDGAVVVDVAGSLTLKKNLGSDEVGWRRLLSLLKRYRPERPIDGVVLTLSASDMLAWEHRPADELRAIGDGLFRVLRQAQRELGVRFPVYVVFTNADKLPGFTSFVKAVPKRFHQDAFGWSTPYALDSAFRSEWVDEAIAEVGDRLRNRSTEVLASRSLLADADAVFRFPDVLDRLRPAMRTILGEIFEESAYHEAFFLRGLYLTGQHEVGAEEAAAPSLERLLLPAASDEGYAHDEAVFAGKLFSRKIFPERGLARGFRRGILDRNRTIRWLQVAVAALVLIGIPGMWVGKVRLERKAQPLEGLLDSVGSNLTSMTTPNGEGDVSQMSAESVVFSLLQQMASLNAGPFWSPFLPSSWFSDLDEEITANLTAGFQDVILPTLRTGIVEWTDTLSDMNWARTLGGRVPLDENTAVRSSERFQEYEVLVGYLSEIRQFTESAERFNQIAQRGSSEMQVFSDLYVWYYEEELPDEFFKNDDFYKHALSSASEQPLSAQEWPGFEGASARVATELTDRFYRRLVEAVDGLERSFAGTADPGFAAADLRMLWQDIGQVQDLLTSSDSSWFDAEGPLAPTLRAEIDSFPDSPLFARDEFTQRFADGFSEVRRRHLTDLSRELELLSRALPTTGGRVADAGPRIDIGPQLETLRSALGDLMARGFMAPAPDVGAPVRPALAGRPTWNLAPLDQALDYFTEFQNFRTGGLADIPPELRGLVVGVASRALEDRVRWSVGRAMTYEVGVGPEGRAGLQDDLRKRLAAFDGAARRLVSMLEIDEQVGGTPAGAAVAETIILEGSDLLNQVDALLEQDRLYEPANNLAVWRGTGPASLVGFGVPDAESLEEYLARQREQLRQLASYAAPILGYFSLQPVSDELRAEGAVLVPETDGLVRKWRGIIRTLDAYESKTPGNSLEALEQFVRQGMAVESLAGCPNVAQQSAATSRDWFESVAVRLGRLLTDRCRQLARQALQQGYTDLSRFFSTRLAGRFPFVDLSVIPDAPDADVAAVQEFLALYDRVTRGVAGDPATLVESLLGSEMPADFFRQIAQTRDFLLPLLSPPEGSPPALPFRAEMRTNRAAERGADQIVEWTLGVGSDLVTYRGGSAGGAGLWHLGDPVVVTLTWASGSQRRPVADTPRRKDMTVEGAVVTWRYTGPWSLLRLLGAHRPPAADLTGVASEDRITANLRVSTGSADGRTEPQELRDALASVFLRVSFSASPGGPSVPFPRFPTHVPVTATR